MHTVAPLRVTVDAMSEVGKALLERARSQQRARVARYRERLKAAAIAERSVALPQSLWAELDAQAAARGLTRALMMQELVADWLARAALPLPAEPAPAARPLASAPPRRRAAEKAKPQCRAPRKKPSLHRQNYEKGRLDAANRLPVLIRFQHIHDYIPWGLRQTLADNGLRKRGKYEWVGRLLPASADRFRDELPKFDGVLEVTGALGEEPHWREKPAGADTRS